MVQIVEHTHDEKVEMYKKYTKLQLIDMLVECNLHLEAVTKQLNKLSVMQAEGSDGAKEAAVGNSAAGKGVCEGSKHAPFSIKGADGILRCAECGEPYHVR